MAKIINFPTSTSTEAKKVKNLAKVLLERFESFDGSEAEVNRLLQEVHSLQAHLDSLGKDLKKAKAS